jgi:DNA-binding transcriptional LysR family regulator
MDNNMLKYQAFVKTAEKGSFTRAADELNYAQSSVSKMVADLEEDWGIKLLDRSKNGVALTSCGEQILPMVREILNGCRELDGYVQKLKGAETGIVKIGTFSSVAINWLPNVFSRLREDYPNIEYEMLLGDYTEIENWILQGRVDCGFLRRPKSQSFDTVLLKRDEYMAVLPVGHPLAAEKSVKIEDLDGQPFLLLENGGKTEVSDLLRQSGVRPEIRLTVWEDYAVMAMAEKGLGIGILPSMILKRIPYKVEIRPLAVPYYRELCLATKRNSRPAPATQKFIEYLKYREED